MKNVKLLIMSLALVVSMVLLMGASPSVEGHYKLSRFISPETCGGCHSEIYEQWNNSMHSLAQKDPVYLQVSDFVRQGLTDKDEILEAEVCVKCHVPVGVITGYPKKNSDDRTKISELANNGIQCDYCHSATGADRPYNNGLKIVPGHGEDEPGIKWGPFSDSVSDFHETKFSKFHTESRICGTCHNVKHVAFGTDLETTYDEWKKGPYNSSDPKKMVTCQGCHMYQREGVPATGSTPRPENPGQAADDAPERKHIFTHYFVGANSFMPGQFNDQTKSKMAEDRLKNAASISVNYNKAQPGQIDVQIKNIGAGHSLPTGLTHVRQMWLEVVVRDEQGKTVYSSGSLDRDGYIPEEALIFNTVFGDGKGNPVSNIAKAREVLRDKRIAPLESITETVKVPEKGWKNLKVHVKLLYRSAPQKALDTIMGRGKVKLPVIEMARVEKNIAKE